jgi:hypothetical protein
MALDADAALPLKWEVSFLLNQADVASPRGLFQALGANETPLAIANKLLSLRVIR